MLEIQLFYVSNFTLSPFLSLFIFRPVIALLEIDVLEVDGAKKEKVFGEVIRQQGPPNGTVVVSTDGEFDDQMVDAVVEVFSDVGEIILVRYV